MCVEYVLLLEKGGAGVNAAWHMFVYCYLCVCHI